MTPDYLIDNSAFARLQVRSLPEDRAEFVLDAMERGHVAVCVPFLLEAGYSARDSGDHQALFDGLLALPRVELGAAVEDRALAAQGQLARLGHHRLPPVDLLIAAAADYHSLGVLHYDADYDVIVEKTDLAYDSVWLAERGSL